MTDLHAPSVLTCASITLDVDTRTLQRREDRFHLTPKECRLLEVLLRHQGQVLTRQFLMREVWQTDYVADTRTLEVHIHWLRQKIEDNRSSPTYIHTVRGVGYVLRATPREVDERA
jgi:DNA-binding response OmpR family regulator